LSKKTIPKILMALTLLMACTGVAAIYGYSQLLDWSDSKQEISGQTDFDFPKGTSLTTLASKLESENLVSNALAFRVYVRTRGIYGKFQAGKYQFSNSSSPVEIIEKISKGDTFNPVFAQFTIPEGFTIDQVRDRLVANGIGTKPEISRLMKSRDFLKKLNVRSKSLEGYLYPATYKFHSKLPSATEALEKMVSELFKRLPKNYEKMANNKGLSLNDAITFASLIEKETLHDDEKPLISEVIWRRLNRGEPLGIDAGLIYGIENYNGDIRWRDLRNAKNPYNSRIHKGLPPTAIGATSISSMEAVLKPANKRYHYYVRKPGKDSRHHFSRTLQEHNLYVKKWVRSRN